MFPLNQHLILLVQVETKVLARQAGARRRETLGTRSPSHVGQKIRLHHPNGHIILAADKHVIAKLSLVRINS